MALNKEAYEVAVQKLIDAIRLPDYYMDFVDESLDLERYNRDCCPLHDEDSPSFFYFEDSGRFHCFGCDKSGFVTDLHFHLKHREDPSYTKVKSLLELSKLYKVEIPNLFKEVSIIEKNNLPKYEKLSFKRKEDLVKPLKKVETDFEYRIKKLKNLISLSDYREIINAWDRILFKDAEIEKGLREIENLIGEKLKAVD